MYNSQSPDRAELPTPKQLFRSTFIAIVSAIVMLVTIVLPAEYGVDPTGIGRLIGLTQMGEIKVQLAEEAAADQNPSSSASLPEAATSAPAEMAPAEIVAQPTAAPTIEWRDTRIVTLAPGEASEIKLTMLSGETAYFHWSVAEGGANFDLHGDGANGAFISYKQGRNAPRDEGEFQADFDGVHGWFWRNRTDISITITLQTRGAYTNIERVL